MGPMDRNRILCVIPARYGSSRFPGKPLACAAGTPLVMWAYRRALESGVFGRVCVATDDTRVMDAVRQHGGDAVMTSPDHRTGTDRVCEVARGADCDFVVNLQGDEPDVPLGLLRSFVGGLSLIDSNSLLTCVADATIEQMSDPNVVKVVVDREGAALYFSRAPIPFDRAGGRGGALMHVGIYGFTRDGLVRFCSFPSGRLEQTEMLEQLRALEYGMKIRCLTTTYLGKGIDTPADLEAFERLARH